MDEYPTSRITVEQYHRMIEAGVLGSDDPVELLEERIVVRFKKSPQHAYASRKATKALAGVLPAGWHASDLGAVTLADGEPEPDACVVRGDIDDYGVRHPGPAEVALVVEVADLSLQRDRTLKMRSYARAAIEHYWIVNLIDRVVEAYEHPFGGLNGHGDYESKRAFTPGQRVPVWIDGRLAGNVPVEDLFP